MSPAAQRPQPATFHPAPWSRALKAISSLSTLALLVGQVALWRSALPGTISLAPLGLLAGAALFAVRGFAISPEALLIHRLGWTTRLPLAELRSARVQPDAMRRSLRLCGNGGLFAFSGLFRNASLGCYRAWVTDPHRSVVLHFARRTVVVSPADPEAFVQELPLP